MRWGRRLLLVGTAVLAMGAAAAEPDEQLADPVQEAHARALFRNVRCLVCQNESIGDSQAPLAADLRRIVRQQVAEGRSNAQIQTFLTDRYGEFVLFAPRFSTANAVLWITPFAIVGVGLIMLVIFRRRATALETPLSVEEMERLSALTRSPSNATVPPQPGPRNAPDV